MSTNEMTGVAATSTASQPESGPRRAAWLRHLTRPGIAATAVVAAFGFIVMSTGVASASSLTNSPTVQVNAYGVPNPGPQYVTDGDLLPLENDTLGNPATIAMTGDAGNFDTDSQVVTDPGDSIGFGTQLTTSTISTSPAQTWYFQRVGYLGVNTPDTLALSGTDMLAVPVYRIINYNPDGMDECLEAWGSDPTAGSIVDINDCLQNGPPQTNQLWIVGSAGLPNDTINASTGAFDGGSSPQIYNTSLQGTTTGSNTYSDSVIENVAALQAADWNTAQAPVLSADSNLPGINAELSLESVAWPVSSTNSTWNILPGYNFNPPSSDNPCAGVTGYATLVCGETVSDYATWASAF